MHGPPQAASLRPVAEAITAALGYAFIGEAGAGGAKEAYEVVDSVGTHLALKVFRPGMVSERTEREIDAMRRCAHPNIARVVAIDLFDHGGQRHVFLIEDFLPGGSLHDRVVDRGLFSATDSREIALRLVDAVAHIASHNLVHRDLKPENILLDASGAPVIDDFGLVRDLQAASLTQSWAIRGPGTPFYAPPEQLNNEKDLIDWRADQFSLAVAIALVTFGVHPYEKPGMSIPELVDAVAMRDGPTDAFIAAAHGAHLTPLVKMAAAWPVSRYRTPALLIAAWGTT